jgi:simple sugar transport system ATP-binding protein
LQSAVVTATVSVGVDLAKVYINEIMYNPVSMNAREEFLEILNGNPGALDVSGWAINAGVRFVIPAGTVIPGNGLLVIAADPVVLEVAGLSRRGEFRDVSFLLRRGEVLGLTGLIGAGRTELAHVLFGMAAPDAGRVVLEGREVRFASNRDAVAAGVAYVSEDRLALGLIQPQSISGNAVLSVLRRITGAAGLLSPKRQDDLVAHWVRELAVKIGQPGDAVSTLSGGNQQRVVLAKWLATEPKVLILDCPTVGVDVGARAGIFRIVRHTKN